MIWGIFVIKNILFLKPIILSQIWGGNDYKNFGIDTNNNGSEIILLSDSIDNTNIIINSLGKSDSIDLYYKLNKKAFNSQTGSIPFVIKLINPASDMGVFFSPNNFYTQQTDYKYGQKKLWIALPNIYQNNLLVGHNCKNSNEIEEMLNYYKYNEYGNFITLNPYEAIFIDNHLLNSICPYAIIFEITFKNFLEYDISNLNEIDDNFYKYIVNATNHQKSQQILRVNSNTKTLINNGFFRVKIFNQEGLKILKFTKCNFVHIFITEGNGKIENFHISAGSNFIIKANIEVKIIGNLKYIVTYVNDLLF